MYNVKLQLEAMELSDDIDKLVKANELNNHRQTVIILSLLLLLYKYCRRGELKEPTNKKNLLEDVRKTKQSVLHHVMGFLHFIEDEALGSTP